MIRYKMLQLHVAFNFHKKCFKVKKFSLSLKKPEYKWVVAAICFLMIFITLGFCSSNRGIYLAAITQALDIKRSAVSLNDSFRFISTAVVNLFFGMLVYKHGTKKLICAGFISLIISTLLYATSSSLLGFYIGGIFLGIGFSWTSTTMVGCIINKWFTKNKGTVMGAVIAANGFGSALATQIVSPIIYQEGNVFGYRTAYKLISLILLASLLIVIIFYKDKPKDLKASSAPSEKKSGHGDNWEGISYESAVKKPFFWAALVCIFLTGFVLQGMTGVAAAHMKDVGMTAAFIADALSLHALSLSAFKFLTGFFYDKFGLRVTMSICDIAAMVVMLFLIFITNSPTGKVLAYLYGIMSAIALPLETIMLPIFAGDILGQKSYNKILGIFVSVNTAGYAFGVPLTNLSYDLFGTYIPVFILFFVTMLAITVVFQFIAKASRCERKALTASSQI